MNAFGVIACWLLLSVSAVAESPEKESELSAPAPWREPRVIERFKSPSKKLVIELVGANEVADEVWIASTGKTTHRRLLFKEPDNTLPLEVKVSEHDLLITVTWSGASMGARSEIFLQLPNGHYTRLKESIAHRAWEVFRKHSGLPGGTTFAHLYHTAVSLHTSPLAVVFAIAGDFVRDEEDEMFGPVYVKYTVDEKRLRVVSGPED